jgi:uncharacterized protein
MSAPKRIGLPQDSFVWRHSVLAYFLLTFGISWLGALAVAAPGIIRGYGVSKTTGIVMFPAMLLGPSVSGIALTCATDGREGLRDLFAWVRRVRFGARWYTALIIPPVLVLAILLFLSRLASAVFAPNHFYLGILFGVPAGVLEEIGWMGYAFPKMRLYLSPLGSAIVLGLLWGLWHLPVINYLGAASPHGAYWLRFFLAFTFGMTAMRVLIAWLYVNTQSVLLAQLMHICSTAALVIFSPPVNAAQEVFWYALYGCALWIVVGLIVASYGRGLQGRIWTVSFTNN